MQTVISRGDALAIKYYSVKLFMESVRRSTFRSNLTGMAPNQAQAMAKVRRAPMQTMPDMPIVRVNDLEKMDGDTVSVDMFHVTQGKPTMGDNKLSGKAQPLRATSMDISINQYRHAVDPGGRMTRKRTRWDLREVCLAELTAWFSRLEDQLCFVHLSGARGQDVGADWVVPLDSDDDFEDIVVNPVRPPSFNRRFLAGDATSVANIASTDILDLEEIDKFRAILDEMVLPPQPVRVPGDQVSIDDPLYLMFVTSRQWHYIEVSSKVRGNDWRTFLAAAASRANMSRHPLFLGQTGIWNGILIKKTNRACRFPSGTTVKALSTTNAVVNEVVPADIEVDRAMLLGGQALAEVYGSTGETGYQVSWNEELTDHKNTMEISGAFMGGKAKLRFKGTDGKMTDFGVATLDSYAPSPNSAAGATLRNALAP